MFRHRNAAIDGLGQITRSQPVRRKHLRIQARLAVTRLQDQIDRLRRQGTSMDIAPLVDASEHRAGVDLGRRKPLLQRLDGPATDPGEPRVEGFLLG
jgi:hypothetical protein